MSQTRLDPRVEVIKRVVEPRRGFWGRWLNLTAPPHNEQTTASPYLREALRKAELVGYFLFVLIFFCIFDITLAIAARHIAGVGEVLGFFILLVVIAYVNRKGHTGLASAILIAAMMISIMFVIIISLAGKGGADLFPTYDFFIYPLIIGSLFMDKRLIFPFSLAAIAFIYYNLFFQPHGPDIEQARGTSTMILWAIRPATIIIVVTIVGWLGTHSVERAILRADHAEDLVEAERQITAQTHQIAEQKAQLEAEIAQILLVHKEAAAGNYTVRVPVRTHETIWQIGRSLNNLLARYENFARDREELNRSQSDVENIAHFIEASRYGQKVDFPNCQSIIGKRLLVAFGASPVLDNRTQTRTTSGPTPGPSPRPQYNATSMHNNSLPLPPAESGPLAHPGNQRGIHKHRLAPKNTDI